MSQTIRVLCLDGGGIRGIFTARLLERFCEYAKIDLAKTFDVIAGTSIGGIQALAYSKGLKPAFMKQLLYDKASEIFNCRAPIGGQAGIGTWGAYLSGLYSSLYPQEPLAKLIKENFGNDKLSDYNVSVVIPSFKRLNGDNAVNVPVYFSNISSSVVPYLSGQSELAANVALATSAAPVYFPPAVFGGCTYVDGGVFLNNAAAFALAIGKAKKPTANRFCVLSIGTGLGDMGYIPKDTVNGDDGKNRLLGITDNLGAIKMVMDVSMSVPPEGVAAELDILSQYTLSNLFNLRLQAQLDKSGSSLDNSSKEFKDYLLNKSDETFEKKKTEIDDFIARLSL